MILPMQAKPLKLYNYLARKKQFLRPVAKNRVGLYTCGPTVYNYAHIGNLRTYVFEDALRRTLEYVGYKVRHVMNVTDVGHLTSDADEGEDKLEAGAKTQQKTVWEVAAYYTESFLEDIEALNIKRAHVLAPATKHVPAQIVLIKKLFARGYAYETPQAIYFDIVKFKRYSRLSRQPLRHQLVGARDEVVADPEKRHPYDFALWFKVVGRFAHHVMRWPSPWGQGFPGWHIECSAISMKYLGATFDIHTGGVDHIAVHHTNEIAQSEGATGRTFAQFFVEGEHLLVDGKKMAKSLGNFYTLNEVKDRGFNPLAFRYLVLASHYRSLLNFTWESLAAAGSAFKQLEDFVRRLKEEQKNSGEELQKSKTTSLSVRSGSNLERIHRSKQVRHQKFQRKFEAAILDDLNTPTALSVVWNLIRDYNKNPSAFDPKQVLRLLYDFDRVLGFKLEDVKPERTPVPVRRLLEEREAYRREKQWGKADAVRRKILQMGWAVEDTPDGARVMRT